MTLLYCITLHVNSFAGLWPFIVGVGKISLFVLFIFVVQNSFIVEMTSNIEMAFLKRPNFHIIFKHYSQGTLEAKLCTSRRKTLIKYVLKCINFLSFSLKLHFKRQLDQSLTEKTKINSNSEIVYFSCRFSFKKRQ